MKRVIVVLGIFSLGLGCATTQPPEIVFNPQLQSKEAYSQLKVEEATPLEKSLLSLPWGQEEMAREAKRFPWLNPQNLTEKDRLFLLRVQNGGKPLAPEFLFMPPTVRP